MMKKICFLILVFFQSYASYSQVREIKAIISESELKLLIYNAEKGDAEAQIELGGRYYYGYGPTQDYDKSFFWIKKSAEQGVSEAQYALAIYYGAGTGVSKDLEKALYWLEKSASQENKYAQVQLGGMYFFGKGVKTDKKKGATWIKKSMDNGSEKAKDIWNKMKLWEYL